MVLSSWQSHCESSSGSFDECRMAPSGRWPKTKPDNLDCESACTGCQNLHPPSPFIIITQPGSWYSFYRPTDGRRLSRPSWLVTYRDGLPVHRGSPILVLLTVSYVAQLRKYWSMRYLWDLGLFIVPSTTIRSFFGTVNGIFDKLLNMASEVVIFTAWCYPHADYMPSQDVKSVRLSVCHTPDMSVCRNGYIYILTVFSLSVSDTVLVFA